MTKCVFLAAVLLAASPAFAAEPVPAKAAPAPAKAAHAPAKPSEGAAADDKPVAVYAYLKGSPGSPLFSACKGAKTEGEFIKAPLLSRQTAACPVAKVGEEVIALRELAGTLAKAHGAPERAGKGKDMDFSKALNRLVETRLLVQEAREMGLDQQPEYAAELQDFKKMTMRGTVERDVKATVRADALEVERLYTDAVRQWQVLSLLFPKEEDAKKAKELAKGKPFEAVAKQMVAEKKATGGAEADYLPESGMLPPIKNALEKLEKGAVSDPIAITGGWVVLRLDGVRYPENPQARADAEKASLERRRGVAVRSFYAALKKKYAVIDERLLDAVDYEAKKPGLKALEKDTRPIVKIRGEKPITVAQLTQGVEAKFFHGMDEPIKEQRVNVMKSPVFEQLVSERLFDKEARVRRIQDTEGFKRTVEEFRKSLVFSKFIEKVLVPGVKVTEADAKSYYDQHKPEFSYPAFYKLESLGFTNPKDAQGALNKLKAGTEFKWLRANADAQLNEEQRTVQLDGSTISAATLPEGVNAQLTGVKAGDYRLYAAKDQHYVIHVLDVTPSKEQPYLETREKIARKLFNEHLAKAIADYAAKLRQARGVEVFITRIGS